MGLVFQYGVSDVIGLLSQMTVARMLEREDFQSGYRRAADLPARTGVPADARLRLRPSTGRCGLGGIDQKFNILVGRDLQREAGQGPQVGVCNPHCSAPTARRK